MIEVKNLTKKYGETLAVNGISFTLESGAIYGFLGPNGAGKSTTMNTITGCIAPTDGTIRIDGLDIYSDALKVKKRLGYLPEVPPLYPELTVSEFLMFIARAKGMKGDAAIDEVVRVMNATNITDKADKLCSHLSKGYKQRVGIAQAIVGDPDMIVLDEPSAGLDPEQIVGMRDLIQSIAGEKKTIILSSHILSEIEEVCDHLLIINRGRIIATDTMENLRALYLQGRNNVTNVKVKGALAGLGQAIGTLDNVISCDWKEEEGDIMVGRIEYPINTDVRPDLFRTIINYSGSVVEITTESPSLEQVYMDLIDADNAKYEAGEIHYYSGEQSESDNGDGDGGKKAEDGNVYYHLLFSNKEDDQ